MKYMGILCFMLLVLSGCKTKIEKVTVEQVQQALEEFIIEVNNITRAHDYDQLVDLYLTEDEMIDLFMYYGKGPSMGRREYEQNVVKPSLGKFNKLFGRKPGGYFDCPGDYILIEKHIRQPTPFSEILQKLYGNKKDYEYYFAEGMYRLECSELTEGYPYKMTRNHKIGEMIYVPSTEWRLVNGM